MRTLKQDASKKHNVNFMTIGMLMLCSLHVIACADQYEGEFGQQSTTKSYGEGQSSMDSYSDADWGSNSEWNADADWGSNSEWNADADWGSNSEWNADADWGSSSEMTDNNDEFVTVNQTSSNQLGGVCAPGCIWSSYAVRMGAQSQESTCNGEACACVVDGDIWSSCTNGSGYTEQVEPTPTPSPSPTQDSNYNATLGNQLADAAYAIAVSRNTVGYCYSAAADAIESVVGRFLWGASAYMAADQLAAHPRFYEVSVSDLRQLPAGVVVVWGRGTSAHGHISVALGDGREASDHVANQMLAHYGGGRARIFYPR